MNRPLTIAEIAPILLLTLNFGCGEGSGAEAEQGATAPDGLDEDQPIGTEILDGSVTLVGTDEVEAFIAGNYREVTGTLEIVDAFSLVDLRLPSLDSLGGLVITGNFLLESVKLPNLASVTGDVDIRDNANLTAVCLPSLVSSANTKFAESPLSELDLSALAHVESFSLRQTSLTALELPKLEHANVSDETLSGLQIRDNAHLEEVSMPLLFDLGDVEFSFSPALTTLSFPALTGAVGRLSVQETALPQVEFSAVTSFRRFSVRENPNVSSLRFPALSVVESSFLIEDNLALSEIDFTTLEATATGQSGAKFRITGNSALDGCAAADLYEHLWPNVPAPVVPASLILPGYYALVAANGQGCEENMSSCEYSGCDGHALDGSCFCFATDDQPLCSDAPTMCD